MDDKAATNDTKPTATLEQTPSVKPEPVLPSKPPTVLSQRAKLPVRVTVVQSVYYQSEEGTTGNESKFSRELSSDELPYCRTLKVGELWKLMDHGWVEQAGMLVLINESTKFHARPTDEEVAEAKARVVEVALLTPEDKKPRDMFSHPKVAAQAVVWSVIHPGESIRLCPVDLDNIHLRCRAGETKVVIYLVPG